jgi:integrase
MSVYKHDNSPFYHFDFQLKGRRFHGTTGRTSEREALAVERAKREEAMREHLLASASPQVMTLDVASGRFWLEVAQHYERADETFRDLARLVEFLGPTTILTRINDERVAELVAHRRGQTKGGRKKDKAGNPVPLVSNATVNRTTVQLLQAIFTRAERAWGVKFERKPNWRHHRLSEPQERVRELTGDEAKRIEAEIRDDYLPFFDFVRASGQRLDECLLRWSEVNWQARQIVKKGKGDRRIVIPITTTIRRILWPLRGHHPEMVFTYVSVRTRKPRLIKGRRYPITYSGVKTAWRRLREKAGVTDFRFHDFRHDLATKLLRRTGNLKLVQKALNHADISTTTKYAHVMTDEVAEALELVQRSRTKSRSKAHKAS